MQAGTPPAAAAEPTATARTAGDRTAACAAESAGLQAGAYSLQADGGKLLQQSESPRGIMYVAETGRGQGGCFRSLH